MESGHVRVQAVLGPVFYNGDEACWESRLGSVIYFFGHHGTSLTCPCFFSPRPKRVVFLASTTVWISVCAVLVIQRYLNEEQLLIDCVLPGGKVKRNNGRVQGAMICRTSWFGFVSLMDPGKQGQKSDTIFNWQFHQTLLTRLTFGAECILHGKERRERPGL